VPHVLYQPEWLRRDEVMSGLWGVQCHQYMYGLTWESSRHVWTKPCPDRIRPALGEAERCPRQAEGARSTRLTSRAQPTHARTSRASFRKPECPKRKQTGIF